jgi:amino acid adenylation domain-containing protein
MSTTTRFSEAGRLRAEVVPPPITEAERYQLLVEWNATQSAYPRDMCIHQLFEAQMQRTPDAVAVIFENERLTYRELNSKANQLAHYLQKLGVGPEVLVGVCVERSLEMLVGLLGILKAGGAYVPLDPAYPQERLAFMIQDSQVKVLLTQERLRTRIPEQEAQVVCLDTAAAVLAQQHVANPALSSVPEYLAYVIYTSGSTGRPKGVAIAHRSTVAFVNWALGVFAAEELAGVLASSSICFDLSVFEFFVPLSSGGTVILVENLLQLPSLVSPHPVTLLNTVPSVLAEVLRRGWLPTSVRTVNLAGEPLRRSLVQRLYQQETIQRVYNLYGPTEDTTYSTFVLVEPGEEEPTIGRPIANTQVYLLDPQLQPVPVGVMGELYIGGEGLARGYLNRPELTAERFLPHPFSDEPGARLYRTGDLACYRPDGNIEYLGRLDHQVKIRGFRVELSEIEAVLNRHPAVREVVVVAHEHEPGEKRLVAYVVFQREHAAATRELREHVMNALPVYMVPSAFVELEALPLTPNGKVDRRGLPAPTSITRTAEEPYVAATLLEHSELIQIWEELLDVRPIGIRDNFFYMGGNSLLAARLVERIEQAFGKELPLSTLFTGPTIEQLVQALQPGAQQHSRTSFVAVQAGGFRRPFFYLHGAWESDAFYCFHLAHHLGPDQPFYALAPYAFDGSGVLPTVEEMAAAHIRLVRSIQPQGPYLLGGFCNGGLVAYEMARQLEAQGQRVDHLVLVVPAYPPVLHALARGVIQRMGALLGLNQERRYTGFLRLRHIYKYLRRQRSAETLKSFRSIDPSIHTLFPTAEALRQDDYALYDWIITGYTPLPYPGEISLIWAREEPFHGAWRKAARAHNVALHVIPGTHINCRTDYVQAFAEELGRCPEWAQDQGSKESRYGESIPLPMD